MPLRVYKPLSAAAETAAPGAAAEATASEAAAEATASGAAAEAAAPEAATEAAAPMATEVSAEAASPGGALALRDLEEAGEEVGASAVDTTHSGDHARRGWGGTHRAA